MEPSNILLYIQGMKTNKQALIEIQIPDKYIVKLIDVKYKLEPTKRREIFDEMYSTREIFSFKQGHVTID